MQAELQRRESLRDRIRFAFLSRPMVWIPMHELAAIGGLGGWRTRVSEVRQLDHLNIQHNGKNGAASQYRYLPYEPLARDAAAPTPQPSLF